jgi:hypothetical protein
VKNVGNFTLGKNIFFNINMHLSTVVLIAIVIVLVLILINPVLEKFATWSGPSFNTGASGEPVGYLASRTDPSAYYIRRWRSAVPIGAGARQVTDDVWDQTYRSGIGYQLG